jgi:cell pole-organizing protein PopZ
MRRFLQQYVFVSILSATVVSSLVLPAYAQSEEARRTDARSLFKSGMALQKAGDYAKALEKFQEAQRLYPAPTITLKIAQCQASLRKLIESAETYRALERMPQQDTWSPEFVLAKEQGRTELEQVEARTPKLRVIVEPQPPGTKLQINNRELDAAFIGVTLPANPGTHHIVAFAPNYDTSEQTVELKEKDALTVTVPLTLTQVSAPKPPEAPAQPAPKPQPAPSPSQPPQPPQSQTAAAAAPSKEVTSAVVIGAGGTVALPFNVPDIFGKSIAGGLELAAGLRFGSIAVLGIYEGMIAANRNEASSTQVHFAGATLGYLPQTDKSSAWLAGGLGYRAVDGGTLSALDARIELGYAVHAARGLRVIPKGVLTMGGFSNISTGKYGFVGLSVGIQYDAIALRN